MYEDRARLDRFFNREDGGQLLVFDFYKLQGFERRVFVYCRDCGNLFPYEADLVGWQERLVLRIAEDAPLLACAVSRCHDRAYAGQPLGLRRIDADDAGVGMRGAEYFAYEHAGQREVRGKEGLARRFCRSIDPSALALPYDREFFHNFATYLRRPWRTQP